MPFLDVPPKPILKRADKPPAKCSPKSNRKPTPKSSAQNDSPAPAPPLAPAPTPAPAHASDLKALLTEFENLKADLRDDRQTSNWTWNFEVEKLNSEMSGLRDSVKRHVEQNKKKLRDSGKRPVEQNKKKLRDSAKRPVEQNKKRSGKTVWRSTPPACSLHISQWRNQDALQAACNPCIPWCPCPCPCRDRCRV